MNKSTRRLAILSLLFIFQVSSNNVCEQSLCTDATQITDDRKANEEDDHLRLYNLLRNVSTQISAHKIGLRNGTFYSGRVQVYVANQWRPVCDHDWDFKDANVLCKQLGFRRGALILRSLFVDESEGSFDVKPVSKLNCHGNETSILKCSYKLSECHGSSPATVTCFRNRYSYCNDGEESIGNYCYRFETKHQSFVDAKAECRAQGSYLAVIESDNEFNYLFERISNRKHSDTWYVAGTPTFIDYHSGTKLKRCMFLYYNVSTPVLVVVDWKDHGILMSNLICQLRSAFICKRPSHDIGCVVKKGESYVGQASVTRSGLPCLPWDTPNLQIFVSQSVFNKTLRGHNYCRNPDGDEAPWCYYSLNKYDFCDIPQCKNVVSNLVGITLESEHDLLETSCSKEQYQCPSGICIQKYWVCDGERDCIGGEDESDCPDYLLEFRVISNRTVVEELHVIKSISLLMCAKYCVDEGRKCQAFVYSQKLTRCLISNRIRNTELTLRIARAYDYYERIAQAVESCEDGLQCANDKCIPLSGRCNNVDDCGDGSDERNCDFSVRLVNSSSPNTGRIEIYLEDRWLILCNEVWDMNSFNTLELVCRNLNYDRGAALRLGYSHFGFGNLTAVVYNVTCQGRETHIRNCSYETYAWDTPIAANDPRASCFGRGSAGVICLPSEECTSKFRCHTGQCISFVNVCDGFKDCSDGSDEIPEHCTGIEVRLVNGTDSKSGRVEIKHYGVWGTICDDDWDEADARVVCRMLGFHGKAEAHTQRAFGRGTGPILLESVQCFGMEDSLEHCEKPDWYAHDCTHYEDAGVTCSFGEQLTSVPDYVAEFLPKDCGTRTVGNALSNTMRAKIAGGQVAISGAYPWHATLLQKRYYSPSYRQLCGASIISEHFVITAAHCLEEDTDPSSYRIRIGDTDGDVQEVQEKDFDVLSLFLHPDYNKGSKLNNDIALVQIKTKYGVGVGFNFGDYVRPICLPSPTTMYVSGTRCYITGWGDTASKASVSQMRAAMVPLLSRSTCSRVDVYGPGRLTAGMLCAGYLEGNIDTCKGDSGGPLACEMKAEDRFVLLGVTSWGRGCAKPNKPGVYAMVGHFLEWIYQRLNESSPRRDVAHATSSTRIN